MSFELPRRAARRDGNRGVATALRVRNARCFTEASVPLHPRLTVLIGENGAGKTTIAELMSSCAGEGEGLGAFPLRAGASSGEAALLRGEEVVARFASDGRAALSDGLGLFAYGRYRRVDLERPAVGAVERDRAVELGASDPIQLLGPAWIEAEHQHRARDLDAVATMPRTASVTRPDHGLGRDVDRTLVSLWERRGEPRIAAAIDVLGEAMRRLGQHLDGLDVEVRDGRPVPVVHRAGLVTPLRHLSDGYQSMLVVVLDVLLRYLHASPRDDFANERALVVIDEVDLHLHPRWQRRVVEQLTKTFPGTQFVLTTHSASVVQGALDAGYPVVHLAEVVGEGRSEVRSLAARRSRGLARASVSSLLTEPSLFGVGSLYGVGVEAKQRAVRELSERVERGEATAVEEKRLLRRLVELEDVVARDEERRSEGAALAAIARSQAAFAARLAALGRRATGGTKTTKRGAGGAKDAKSAKDAKGKASKGTGSNRRGRA